MPDKPLNAAAASDVALSARLSALALHEPPEDRLPAILAASRSAPNQRKSFAWPLLAAAASVLAIALLASYRPFEPAASAQIAKPDAAAAEIEVLIAKSQLMEVALHTLSQERARLSQLESLRAAQHKLLRLDSDIASLTAAQPQDKSLQRALWRERLELMHAVEQGEYRPALLLVD
jgi:predicted TIM-barrel fold metal-dependent hydrolase